MQEGMEPDLGPPLIANGAPASEAARHFVGSRRTAYRCALALGLHKSSPFHSVNYRLGQGSPTVVLTLNSSSTLSHPPSASHSHTPPLPSRHPLHAQHYTCCSWCHLSRSRGWISCRAFSSVLSSTFQRSSSPISQEPDSYMHQKQKKAKKQLAWECHRNDILVGTFWRLGSDGILFGPASSPRTLSRTRFLILFLLSQLGGKQIIAFE